MADEQEIVHWGFRSLLTGQDWVEHYLSAQTAEEAIEVAAPGTSRTSPCST